MRYPRMTLEGITTAARETDASHARACVGWKACVA